MQSPVLSTKSLNNTRNSTRRAVALVKRVLKRTFCSCNSIYRVLLKLSSWPIWSIGRKAVKNFLIAIKYLVVTKFELI